VEHLKLKFANAPAFKDIPPSDLALVIPDVRFRDYRNDDVVFSRGERGDCVFVVMAGFVKVGTLGENGKKIAVEIFKELDMIGEVAVIDGAPRSADGTAMGPTKLALISAATFRQFLHRSPVFAANMLRLMAARLRRTYSLFEDASLADLEYRFARQVLYLMGLGAAGERSVRIYSRLNQGDLADLLGTTARSIITILNKWRAEGLADFDGRTAQLTILDLERFRVLGGPR
jgi:CRP/FNR family transcriptional regulator, cyclic AMP receptor protein